MLVKKHFLKLLFVCLFVFSDGYIAVYFHKLQKHTLVPTLLLSRNEISVQIQEIAPPNTNHMLSVTRTEA